MYDSTFPPVGLVAYPSPRSKPALKETAKRRVCVLSETPTGTENHVYLFVPIADHPSEAVLLSRAANLFRDRFGYEDRIVGVDLYPQ